MNSSVAAKRRWRSESPPDKAESYHGVPLFLNQLREQLRDGAVESEEISDSAKKHGHDLLKQGFNIDQVVHDYGDVCQSITELAVELGAPISTEDFRTLNRCLDNAIAGAVTEFTLEQGVTRDKDFAELAEPDRCCDIRVPGGPDWLCGSRREHRGSGRTQLVCDTRASECSVARTQAERDSHANGVGPTRLRAFRFVPPVIQWRLGTGELPALVVPPPEVAL